MDLGNVLLDVSGIDEEALVHQVPQSLLFGYSSTRCGTGIIDLVVHSLDRK